MRCRSHTRTTQNRNELLGPCGRTRWLSDTPAGSRKAVNPKPTMASSHMSHPYNSNIPLPIDDEAVAAADKEMEERANRAKELLSQRYKGLRIQQVCGLRFVGIFNSLRLMKINCFGALSFLLVCTHTSISFLATINILF
jgi:hypothetical protein